MSANTQTITAKYNNMWYCWVETAEDCSPDGSGILEISVFDSGVFKGKTEREAMSKAFQAYDGDIEYENIRAVDGKAYLVKDGTRVFIKELRPEKRTRSKKEQVANLERRVAELERKFNVAASLLLNQKSIAMDTLQALREISETLDIAAVSIQAHSLDLSPEQKAEAIKTYFSKE